MNSEHITKLQLIGPDPVRELIEEFHALSMYVHTLLTSSPQLLTWRARFAKSFFFVLRSLVIIARTGSCLTTK